MVDPFRLIELHWPKVVLSREQIEIIRSVWRDDETVVVAGNQLGKDYVSSIIVLTFFLAHYGESTRVITTSVADKHLGVLWGEIDARIRDSRYAITTDQGGPLVYNSGAHELWRTHDGILDKESYVWAIVAEKPEKFSGHHARHTLLVVDEASGVPNAVYDKCTAWAKHRLIIGNPWPCDNFFRKSDEGKAGTGDPGGDIRAEDNGHYHRKFFRVKAESSPNVRLGLAQKANGKKPTDEVLVPGIVTYGEYVSRRKLWDPLTQRIGLDAQFPAGSDIYMFPRDWLDLAEKAAEMLRGAKRFGRAMGIDSAEGGDNTSFKIVDELGVLAGRSLKTADTSIITGEVIALGREYNVPAENWMFDRGGGGKQHADRLRSQGYPVRTVAFGEAATPPLKRGMTTFDQKIDRDEVRYVYKNKRAEMYGILRERLNPNNGTPFAIPAEILNRPRTDGKASLRYQLQPIPLRYDSEGRMVLLPKTRKNYENKEEECLLDLIGCSPDEADALVLAVYGMTKRSTKSVAGVMK